MELNGRCGHSIIVLRNRNKRQSNRGMSTFGSLSTTYKMSSKSNSCAFLWLLQPPLTFQNTFSTNLTLTWNATYQLIKNKLNASINLNNPFPTNFAVATNVIDPDFESFNRTVTRRRAFGISLNWNFGKLSENVSKKKGVKNDDLL